MRETLAGVLAGSKPRLEFVAVALDGTYYLSFAIDRRYDEKTMSEFVAVTFRADPKSATPLKSFLRRLDTSTPMDTVREEEQFGAKKKYDVLFIADELELREAAKHEDRTKQ